MAKLERVDYTSDDYKSRDTVPEKDRKNVFTSLKEKGESLKRSLFTKPEILQQAERYLRKNFYDPGWIGEQVPGNQTWMETKPKEAWESYEGIAHPNLQRGLDMAKVVPNAAWNLAQFVGNMGWEGANALDRWVMGDPLIKKENKYKLDAWQSNKFGFPPIYEDNPYAEKNKEDLEGIYDTAEKESDDYWSDILKKNDENKDKFHDDIAEYTYDQIPEYSDWVWNNPEAEVEDYNKLWNDTYNARVKKLHGDAINTVFDNSINSQMFSKYGFGEGKDVSAFKDFDMWDYTRALDYATPEAEEFYKGVEILPEVLFPLGSLSKIGKIPKLFRGSGKSEGIMGAKRLEGPKYDWAEEWLRTRGG